MDATTARRRQRESRRGGDCVRGVVLDLIADLLYVYSTDSLTQVTLFDLLALFALTPHTVFTLLTLPALFTLTPPTLLALLALLALLNRFDLFTLFTLFSSLCSLCSLYSIYSISSLSSLCPLTLLTHRRYTTDDDRAYISEAFPDHTLACQAELVQHMSTIPGFFVATPAGVFFWTGAASTGNADGLPTDIALP
jgi:hypothetical protein